MSIDAGPPDSLDTPSMRVDYDRAVLHRDDLDPDPIAQLGAWLRDAVAADAPEPNAFALATADADGAPAVRIVLLKGFDARGLRFFTNYRSAKGRQLAARPRASGCFWWHALQRQIRVTGTVERISREESAEYFHSRPRKSQLGAWASPQSQILPDREALEARMREAEERFDGRAVELPPTWGGYRLSLERMELWQGRRSRLHDRFVYRLDGESWRIERLAP